jgi:hypothetical protein
MFSGGTLVVKKLARLPTAADLASAPVIFTKSPNEQILESKGYRVTRIALDSTPFARSEIGRLILEKTQGVAKHQVPDYWVAERVAERSF